MTTDCTQLRVGDINVQLLATILEDGLPVNLTTATSMQLLIRKPSGTLLTISPSFFTDGSDGKIYYNTASGDLDEEGMWKIQGSVAISSGLYRSTIKNFQVYGNI